MRRPQRAHGEGWKEAGQRKAGGWDTSVLGALRFHGPQHSGLSPHRDVSADLSRPAMRAERVSAGTGGRNREQEAGGRKRRRAGFSPAGHKHSDPGGKYYCSTAQLLKYLFWAAFRPWKGQRSALLCTGELSPDGAHRTQRRRRGPRSALPVSPRWMRNEAGNSRHRCSVTTAPVWPRARQEGGCSRAFPRLLPRDGCCGDSGVGSGSHWGTPPDPGHGLHAAPDPPQPQNAGIGAGRTRAFISPQSRRGQKGREWAA